MLKLPFKLGKTKKPAKFITVDISSNSVRCAVLEMIDQTISSYPSVRVISVAEAPIDPGAVRSGNIVNMESVNVTTGSLISQLDLECGEKIKDVIFGIKGDLSLGLMTTVKIVRDLADEVSQREFDDIYKKTLEAARDQANDEALQITGTSDVDLEMVTTSVIYARLDDRLVTEVVGQQGKKIELALFTAFTPVYHVRALQKLSKDLGLNIIALASDMYALVKSLKVSKYQENDFVIMSVGSDVTDVAVVFGGGVVATRSLYLGRSHFTLELVSRLGLNYSEAESKLKQYALESLSEEESLNIHSHLTEISSLWLSGVELLFGEFTGVKTFASKIFLTGEGSAIPDLLYVLRKEPWTKSIPFKSPPDVARISKNDLNFISDPGGKLDSLNHISLAVLTVIYLEANDLTNA